MANRYEYDTLNVSVNTENRNPSKLIRTLDYDQLAESQHEDNDSDLK
jgi:hypothetical protein